MKNQSNGVLGNHNGVKILLIAFAVILILATAASVAYQFWLGTNGLAFGLSFVLLVEILGICYCNTIAQLFQTLDKVEDLISD